jgi:2-isopropylmalate synthase
LEADGIRVSGRGVSTDVVEASARAYLSAVNKVMRVKARSEVRHGEVGP